MRLVSLFLITLALPAGADTLTVPGPVRAVTLYGQGATVTRNVTFTAPPGRHEVIVPGLARGTDPALLRIRAPEGVTVGAVSLVTDRQPATPDLTAPAVIAARAEVERLEQLVDGRKRAIAALLARGEAARARVAFLQSLATAQAQSAVPLPDPAQLRALADLVGEELVRAREEELAAQAEADAATRAMRPGIEDWERARAALAALLAPPVDDAPALLLAVQTGGGAVTLTVDAITHDAGWAPTHDLRLDTAAATVDIARGATVWQHSGEDWRGINLTLSTARPSEQSAPSTVWPDLRRIGPPPPPMDYVRSGAAMESAMPMAAPVAEAAIGGFATDRQGAVFTYRFSVPVDLRTGADTLRLSMDTVQVAATVRAEAVALTDATAFLVAAFTNTTGQPILPGPAMLYADGALVGGTELDLLTPGGEATLGFGALDGLRLTRTIPDRRTGAEGIITSQNRTEETARVKVENLTDKGWAVRLTDRVPYSEQDDLEITWSATPAPTTTDPDGRRGLLEWDFDLPAGETREIRIQTRMTWPRNMVLR